MRFGELEKDHDPVVPKSNTDAEHMTVDVLEHDINRVAVGNVSQQS